MVEDPQTAKVIDYLESVRVGKTKPFADGGFASQDSSSGSPVKQNVSFDNPELIAIMSELKEVLQKIKDEGIIAYILKNAKNGKEVHEMAQEYLDLVNKNKHN